MNKTKKMSAMPNVILLTYYYRNIFGSSNWPSPSNTDTNTRHPILLREIQK